MEEAGQMIDLPLGTQWTAGSESPALSLSHYKDTPLEAGVCVV